MVALDRRAGHRGVLECARGDEAALHIGGERPVGVAHAGGELEPRQGVGHAVRLLDAGLPGPVDLGRPVQLLGVLDQIAAEEAAGDRLRAAQQTDVVGVVGFYVDAADQGGVDVHIDVADQDRQVGDRVAGHQRTEGGGARRALVDDVLGPELADRAVDLDPVPVDRQGRAGEEAGLQHRAGGEGVGLLRLHRRVAARIGGDVHRPGGGMQRIGRRARAAGLVEALGEVGGPHVARIGAAQPQSVDHVPTGSALVGPDAARAGVVGPAAGKVELDHLHEGRVGDQRDAGFAVDLLGLDRPSDVRDLGELDADCVGAVGRADAAQSGGQRGGAAVAGDRAAVGLVARRVGWVFDQLQDALAAEGAAEGRRDRSCAPAVEQLAVHRQLGHVLVHGGDVHLGDLRGVAQRLGGAVSGSCEVDGRGDRHPGRLSGHIGVRGRRGGAGAEQVDRHATGQWIGGKRCAADGVAVGVLHRVDRREHVQQVQADLVHPPGVVAVLVVAVHVPVVEEAGRPDVPLESRGGRIHHAAVAQGVGAAEVQWTAGPPQDE